MDFLVAGLGNPGPEHARDRHNIGWMVVDELARRHDGSFRSKFRGRLGDVRVGEAKLALLKPETYMNLSGNSLGADWRVIVTNKWRSSNASSSAKRLRSSPR